MRNLKVLKWKNRIGLTHRIPTDLASPFVFLRIRRGRFRDTAQANPNGIAAILLCAVDHIKILFWVYFQFVKNEVSM